MSESKKLTPEAQAFNEFCGRLVNVDAKAIMTVVRGALAAKSDRLLRVAEIMAAVKTCQENAGTAFSIRSFVNRTASESKPGDASLDDMLGDEPSKDEPAASTEEHTDLI